MFSSVFDVNGKACTYMYVCVYLILCIFVYIILYINIYNIHNKYMYVYDITNLKKMLYFICMYIHTNLPRNPIVKLSYPWS